MIFAGPPGLGATNFSAGLGGTVGTYGLGATTHAMGLYGLGDFSQNEKWLTLAAGAVAGWFLWKHRRKLKRNLKGALGLGSARRRRRR